MSYLEFPFIEFYMSDYMQLGFIIEDVRTKKGNMIGGFNAQDSDGVNVTYLNLYYIGNQLKCLKELPDIQLLRFLDWFEYVWTHEWLHLIGLTEEMINTINKKENTIIIDS